MNTRTVKIFLRLSIAFGFVSACADRLELWPKSLSTWGNWLNFLEYTQTINPWIPNYLIASIGSVATMVEIVFAICLLLGFKTELFAKLSGCLLLTFALSMSFSIGIKPALDYSVYISSAGAFALSLMKEKYLGIDSLFIKND